MKNCAHNGKFSRGGFAQWVLLESCIRTKFIWVHHHIWFVFWEHPNTKYNRTAADWNTKKKRRNAWKISTWVSYLNDSVFHESEWVFQSQFSELIYWISDWVFQSQFGEPIYWISDLKSNLKSNQTWNQIWMSYIAHSNELYNSFNYELYSSFTNDRKSFRMIVCHGMIWDAFNKIGQCLSQSPSMIFLVSDGFHCFWNLLFIYSLEGPALSPVLKFIREKRNEITSPTKLTVRRCQICESQ